MLPIGSMDPVIHKRFLDYRDAYEYFGRDLQKLTPEEFGPLDAEFRALEQKGEEARDDEEQARFDALARLLLRD